MDLIEFAEYASAKLEGLDDKTRVSLDGNLLAEAVSFLAMASRWANHPAWPGLKATLATDEAAHTVMLLLVAAYLADANNGVGIHIAPSKQHVATADIWIEPDLSQRVDLEVKTPLGLRGPRDTISQEHAVTILERALKKSSRQRRNTMSSLLVVGGYHLGDSFETVVSTAKALFALERRKWQRLAAILIVDCTYTSASRLADGATTFSPVARVELCPHPGYRGSLSIRQDLPPTSALPEPS